MPQTVNVPGVGPLQFPDGMSDQDMAAAIQKNFPQIHGQPPQASLKGAADVAVTGVQNALSAIPNAAIDLASRATGFGSNKPIPQAQLGQAGQSTMAAIRNKLPSTPNGLDVSDQELRESLDPSGKIPIERLRAQYAQESQKSTAELVKGTVAGDLVGNALQVGGDVATLAPVAGIAGKVAGAVADEGRSALSSAPLWRQAGFKSQQEAASYASGFRNGQGQGIATSMAGPDARRVLTNNNADVGNVIAHHAAGVAHDTPLSYEAIDAARAAPEAVYDRVAAGLPTGPLDAQARAAIAKAGSTVRITQGSPDAAKAIQTLRNQLMDKEGQFTGEQIKGELSGLRQDGFANLATGDTDKIAIGRAQLGMADAIEGHIERNLSPASGTSVEQLRAARQAIAQNYAVREALRGQDIDLAALGRMYRASPDKFSGGLKVAAQFAEDNGSVVGRRIKVDDTALRVQAAGRFNLMEPTTYPQALKFTGLPQAALRGGGAQWARRMYPGRPPTAFDPLPVPPPQ